MTDFSETDWEQITTHLTKECSVEEWILVQQSLAQHPEWQKAAEQVQRWWDRAEPARAPLDMTAMANRVVAAVSDAPKRSERLSQHAFKRPAYSKAAMFSFAATVAVVLGAVFLPSLRHLFTGSASETPREYATAQGQRSQIQLPDGSHVILGPASRLTYQAEGRAGERTLTLRGQAYFGVVAGTARPFVVQAGTLTTRVLGTGFTVRAYPDDRVPQVAVSEGKVAVEAQSQSVTLVAGDIGRLDVGALVVERGAKVADVLGWTRGEFRLRDVTLREVAMEIERQYAVQVRIADAQLAERTLTVAFAGQSVQDLAAAITAITGTTAVWDSSTLILGVKGR